MKKITVYIFILIICSQSVLYAGVDLPYSTSFDCDAWTGDEYADWPPPNCPGIDYGSGSGAGTKISSDANNPLGSGNGMGFLIGDGDDINSIAAQIALNTYQTEFWMRWYIKYETGFAWDPLSYEKLIYTWGFKVGGGVTGVSIITLTDNNEVGLFASAEGVTRKSATGNGWTKLYPTGISDGSWHYFEAHFKMDTDTTDGIGQLWVDGDLKIDASDVNYAGSNTTLRSEGWRFIIFDSNQLDPDNNTSAYTYWDDIAISNTGYIGPLDSTDPSITGGTNISPGANIQ